MSERFLSLVALAALGLFPALPVQAADDIGIFETIHESSVSFAETNEALQQALGESDLQLHAFHDVRLPNDLHEARVYVLTSPSFLEAAAAESPRTISAQILRLAVFTTGDEQNTYINMANPVAHAMVYYADSSDYHALVTAARETAASIRALVKAIPGDAVSQQAEPVRSENHYRKYKGDGPARMMAKFRNWRKSQLLLLEDSAENFEAVVEKVTARLGARSVSNAEDTVGWEVISTIRPRDDAVYIGLTNPYIEDKMVRINSRFRSDGKSDASPYPGVDHVAALPTDLLIVREGNDTLVLHYGQMWRMQLYFWDSGYRAFTANVGVPGKIVSSIEDSVQAN